MSKNKIAEFSNKLRVPFKGPFSLLQVDPEDTLGLKDKKEAKEQLQEIQKQLQTFQEILYAQSKHALLIVLQAMDTGGKDSTIRHVFGPLNPQGVRVISFKVPTAQELAHDFLWRVHQKIPAKGMIHVFNRSHYEDVLIVRVHQLVPEEVIVRRYKEIKQYEKYLADNGVTILKFFLYISKDEQKKRLQDRLDQPDKRWKFNKDDLKERAQWDQYMEAYNKALKNCSATDAPWYVIPANHKWARDLMVASIVQDTLKNLDLKYPEIEEGLEKIIIPD